MAYMIARQYAYAITYPTFHLQQKDLRTKYIRYIVIYCLPHNYGRALSRHTIFVVTPINVGFDSWLCRRMVVLLLERVNHYVKDLLEEDSRL